MDIVVWMLTGAALGWIAHAYLGLGGRGLIPSMAIGALGAMAGGKIVAPMFTTAAEVGLANIIFAAAVAAAVLAASNLIHKRWGV